MSCRAAAPPNTRVDVPRGRGVVVLDGIERYARKVAIGATDWMILHERSNYGFAARPL